MVVRWPVLLSLLVACGSHAPPVEEPADGDVGDLSLRGAQTLTSSQAIAAIAEPCPSGATAKGWYLHGERWTKAAWCEDERGLLQGADTIEGREGTQRGHYRDGVADGTFSGPEGQAMYKRGQLDGTCTTGRNSLTFRAGRLDGPATWAYGDWCDVILASDTGGASQRDCLDANVTRGIVVGTFADDTLQTLSIRASGRNRDIVVESGTTIELPELDGDPVFTREFSSLAGPLHEWDGWPRCPYANDATVHRALRPD